MQQFAYMPYGELLVEGSSVDLAYRFSAKETDRETGLSYFGARYYDPTTAMWLGTDPLMNLFPGLSPYNYCYNNPIVFIDRFGLEGESYKQNIMLPEVEVAAERSVVPYQYQILPDYLNGMQYVNLSQNSQFAQNAVAQHTNIHNLTHNIGNWCNFITNASSCVKYNYDYLYKYNLSYYTEGVSTVNTTKFFGKTFGRGALKAARPAFKAMGKFAPIISYGVIVDDVRKHGPKAHQVADAAITTGLLYLSVVNPVAGIAASLLYFAADLTCQYLSGKTLTEHFIDPAADYVYDTAVNVYEDVSW